MSSSNLKAKQYHLQGEPLWSAADIHISSLCTVCWLLCNLQSLSQSNGNCITGLEVPSSSFWNSKQVSGVTQLRPPFKTRLSEDLSLFFSKQKLPTAASTHCNGNLEKMALNAEVLWGLAKAQDIPGIRTLENIQRSLLNQAKGPYRSALLPTAVSWLHLGNF